MATNTAKIKVNFASADELQLIPGSGPQTAKTIVAVRRMQGNITPELLEALMRRNIQSETMEILDFQERWDPSEAEDTEGEAFDTMIEHHGREKGTPSSVFRVEAEVSQQQKGEEAKLRQIIESSVEKILLAQKSTGSNPVVKPKRFAHKSSMPLVESSDEEVSPTTPRHKFARSSGRKTRLIPHVESDDDDEIKWYGKSTNVGTSTPFPAKKDKKPKLKDIPKSLAYDGKTNLKSFWLKFSQYADSCGWSDNDCRTGLLHCLTGKALDFCARHLRANPDLSFKELVKKMEGRFGEMLADSAQAMFFSAKQRKDESLEDWSDRIQSLATEAFADLPEKYANQQTVDRFCQGLFDAEAGHSTFMQKFPTMELAMNDIRLYQYSKSDITGKPKHQHSGAVDYDDSIAQAYTVQATSEGQMSLTDLNSKVKDLTDKMDMLLKAQDKNRNQRPRGFRRSKGSGCFSCGDLDHFAKNCPKKRENLNDWRAGKRADSRPSQGRAKKWD